MIFSTFAGCCSTFSVFSTSAAVLVSGLLLAFLVGATSVDKSGVVGAELSGVLAALAAPFGASTDSDVAHFGATSQPCDVSQSDILTS